MIFRKWTTSQEMWLTHIQDRFRTLRTHVVDSTRQDFIRFLQTYPLADRLVLHQMEDMHILRVADGVSPSAGKDVNGPTAAASSVAKLDHFIVSNGTLFNQKFHPSALSGREGLEKFVALIRSYFDQKGMHMQFNVVSRETLLDAQAHPENYKHLVVRVAGYSALFTTLSKSLQDDIIRRTEQGF